MASSGGKERKRNRWGPPANTGGADPIFRPPTGGNMAASRPLPPYPTSSSNSMFLQGPSPHSQYPNPIFSQHPTTTTNSLSIPPPPPPPRHNNNNHQHGGLASRWIPPPPPPPRIPPPPPPPRNSVAADSSNRNAGSIVIAQLRMELEQTKSTNAAAPDTTTSDSDMEESDDDAAVDRRSTPDATMDDFQQQASLIFQDAMSNQPSFAPDDTNAVPSSPEKEKTADSQKARSKNGNDDNNVKSMTAPEQSQGTDRVAKLRVAKEKLRHAQAKLVSALKGKKNVKRKRPPDTLPPIAALSQDLCIRDFSGPAHLVDFLPEVELLPAGQLDVIPATSSDEVEDQDKPPPNLQQQGHTLRKSLLLLKKKKLELTLKKQQRLSPTNTLGASTAAAIKEPAPIIRPPLNKEALKKRQEELQQAVDTAYWKRLILKQRNLLATSQETLAQTEGNLQTCRDQMVVSKREIGQCEESLAETTVREDCLNDMISRSTQRVLAARKKRHDAMEAADKKKRDEQQQPNATRSSKKKKSLARVDVDLT
mmetsp:Transcript_9262/g.15402  ORF Transcript_9262/g.15402 Transcript_9262/m.15402 type:complete len:536 (+) Transcript_9262:122-1729(+)|eukprot:CAMPEP_0119021374 /NCGR_PEP_ID=MMETSP1176-20130426/25868_1 /TAXON_ID=265551 /ORGANISM="Synedropsis recta cf, Strain CCMP1620" /LENGTH=535 /DNA_ID=CAMNT_0006975961 /DNA_START=17 /DNA_END=1624 /DNA_ORIENTATION=-